MQNFDIVTIRIFLAVARAGSIGAAARREHIAASAVSRRISDLEHSLNVSLIHRTPSGITLTAAGDAFCKHCEAILECVADARVELNQFAEGDIGELRIAAVTSVFGSRLPHVAADFQHAYPEVRLSLTEIPSASGLRYLREDLADMVIISDNFDIGHFDSCLYSEDPVWVIASEDHPLFKRCPSDIDFEQTLAYPHLSLNEGGVLSELISSALKELGQRVEHRVHVSRINSLLQCVRAGLGLGFVRQSAAMHLIDTEFILGAPLSNAWAMRRLLSVYPKAPKPTPTITRFLEHLNQ